MSPASLFRRLGNLTLPTLARLGGVLGVGAYWASATYRRHLRDNMRQALGPDRAAPLFLDAAANAGRGLLELPFLWQRPLDDILAQVVEVRGWGLVEQAQADRRGVVFLTPHLGCFDVTSLVIGSRIPITILYRPPKLTWLAPFMEAGRAQGQVKLAPAELSGVRRLMSAIKKGEAIGLLPDQVPGKGEGVWLPFFGRPAYTMTLAARLTQVGDAAVVFAFGERLPGGSGFRVHFCEPPVPIEGDTLARAAAINACVEAMIREQPALYLWGYNRYKVPAGAESPPPWSGSAA